VVAGAEGEVSTQPGSAEEESPKKASKKKASKKKTSKKAPNKFSRRTFPPLSLPEALRVPQAIKEKNAGNEWSPDQVARACGLPGRTARAFFGLAASARDYTLTSGSRDTPTISLTEIGRTFVYAASNAERLAAAQAAFDSVPLFKQLADYYGGNEIPPDEFFNNVVEDKWGVPPDQHADLKAIFVANREYLAGLGAQRRVGAKTTEEMSAPPGVVKIVGERNHDRTAFVAMPFSEKGKRPPGFFLQVLTNVLRPAGNMAGFNVETAIQGGSDVIQSTILRHVLCADLVIVDLTDHNPNVLFELGMRIVVNRPVVLIRATGTPPHL
jgi:hypothetical protein